MIRSVVLATTAVASILAMAPATNAAEPVAVATSASQGVISYPPEFFAASQPQTAQDMLARLPGFNLNTGDSVRGFEGGGGNVLIDGKRPTTKTDDLEEVLRRVPASQVARIDVIRGGAPGIDMQGQSVIANVVKKAGGGFRGLFALANASVYDGRQAPGVRLEMSGGKDGRNWEGSARYGAGVDDGAGDGPQVKVSPTGAVIRSSDVDSEGDLIFHILTGAYEQPLAGGTIKFNGRLYREKFKYEEDNRVVFPTPELLNTDEVYNAFETEFGGTFNRDFGKMTSLEVIALRQTADKKITSDFRSAGDNGLFALDRESSESIGRAVLKHRRSDQLSFELGGEGAFNKLESQTRLVDNGTPVNLPAANVTVEETRGEVFAKSVWKPSTALTLEAGLRFEGSAISSDGDVALEKTLYFAKPRFAATWAPSSQRQVRVRFERVVGQLDFDDFVAESSLNTGVITAGNPDLDPEQAWVAEVAFEQRFWKDGVAVLTLRHSALSDVVDSAPVTAPNGAVFDAPSNIGKGTKDELTLDVTVPLAKLGMTGGQLKGQSTWRRSEVTDPTTGADREISGLRPLDWEVSFTNDVKRWNASFGVNVYGAWRETYYRFDAIETIKLKTFVTPFVEWRAKPDLVVRAELQNATERGLRRTRDIYAGPRDTSGLALTDDRDLQFGRMFWVRVRKTFGS